MGVTPPMTPMRVWSFFCLWGAPGEHLGSNSACGEPPRLWEASRAAILLVASLLVVILLVGSLPGRKDSQSRKGPHLPDKPCFDYLSGHPASQPAYIFNTWVLPGTHLNSACGEHLGSTRGAPGEQICLWGASLLLPSLKDYLGLGVEPGSTWGASLVVNLLVGSFPGRKSACGEPPAKLPTSLFYPRSPQPAS